MLDCKLYPWTIHISIVNPIHLDILHHHWTIQPQSSKLYCCFLAQCTAKTLSEHPIIIIPVKQIVSCSIWCVSTQGVLQSKATQELWRRANNEAVNFIAIFALNLTVGPPSKLYTCISTRTSRHIESHPRQTRRIGPWLFVGCSESVNRKTLWPYFSRRIIIFLYRHMEIISVSNEYDARAWGIIWNGIYCLMMMLCGEC